MAIVINSIYYYPVKGLGGTLLDKVDVLPNGLPFDRRFGLEFADSSELFAGDGWKPWNYFVSLKKYEAAALVSAAVEQADDELQLILQHKNGECVRANPAVENERRRLEGFLMETLGLPSLRLFDSGEGRLYDEQAVPLSLVSTATVQAFACACDMPVQAARFRANVIFDGGDAWAEEQWRGNVRIGETLLTLGEIIPRCATTTVNPDSAERDFALPEYLVKQRGHNCLGVFAFVPQGGEIAAGMELVLESPA